jgi:DNA-binding beta-propeller fold protein YncE
MKVVAAALLVFLAGSTPTTIPVGGWTYGLAASNGAVWAGTLDSGQVVRIDPATGKVTKRLNAGVRFFNLVAAPGAVWAVDNALGAAVRIDTRTGAVTRKIPVGYGPYDVEWGFGSAWVANAGSGAVWRITGSKVVAKIRTGAEPNGLTAYRGALWVSDHTNGKVVRIDPATNRVTGSVAVAGADWIVGDGGSLLVSQETNHVAKVDIASLKVVGSVATGRNPLGSALVGGKLWVPCIDSAEIDVVDPATMKVVSRKKTTASPIVVLPAFGHVYVSHTSTNALTRY